MLVRIFAVSVFALLGSASVSLSACLKDADVQKLKPDIETHKEEMGQSDGSIVSIYRQRDSKRFVEIVRKNRCISSAKLLSASEVDQKYDLMASLWEERAAAQEEGLDNEGMPEEDEAANAPDPDVMFPFLSFDKFAVTSAFTGRGASPQFEGRDRQFADFRTRIAQSMKQGADFAGEYAITEIGCGSSCTIAILSNLRTGQQFKFPYGGDETGPMQLKHNARSRLLIATRREGNKCLLESMLFDGAKWTTLARPSIGDTDVCYEPIDENISRYKKSLSGAPQQNSGSNASSAQATARAAPVKPPAPVARPTAKQSDSEYEDINVTALNDLYTTYYGIEACYELRRGKIPTYISDEEMAKAKAAAERFVALVKQRAPTIDAAKIKAEQHQLTKIKRMGDFFEGQTRYIYKSDQLCRAMLAQLPTNPDETIRRRKAQSASSNRGSGIIVPQDPRFR